jgi:MFS transporter, MHS family, proline/betaine transporter
VGLYIRRHLDETDEFLAILNDASRPVRIGVLLREHTRAVLASFLLVVCTTTAYYVVLLYMPTDAKTQLGSPLGDAFAAQLIALAWMILLTPVFGIVSDRVGRRPVILAAALGYFLARRMRPRSTSCSAPCPGSLPRC